MKEDWQAVHFNFVPYKDTDLSILSAIDDVQVLLDDHIVKTTTMKNSPFIAPFEKDINDWDHTLVCILLFETSKKSDGEWQIVLQNYGQKDNKDILVVLL